MSQEFIETSSLQDVFQRLQQGDAAAREELLGRATQRVERLARKMLRRFPDVRRWEESSDVLQMALVKLHRALSAVSPANSREFYGLAAEQIRRVLIDLARRYRGPEGLGANHASVLKFVGDESRPAFDPEDVRERDLEHWERLHGLVEKLPVDEREVFSLTFYHGWKQEAIAELLQVSERTVRRTWRSALLRLNEDVGGDLGVEV